jgi:two-component system OmpR family sensor kinase
VRGDLGRARRVISNLLDNAIKYTPPGGTIEVSMSTTPDRAWLSIADSGIGIAPDVAARVFERFYRGDASRSTVGHGLGLSLARALVRAYDGEITVRATPGKGSVFTVEWPAWPGDPDETVMPRSSSG